MRKEVIPTKINIYYGGRGVMEDPTIYVLNKMTEVLNELRVEVSRYNIFEDKNAIATLPSTLKDADGIILATTVEWFGIGGFMQQFLDMCWLYADKEALRDKYMLPVVMATTYGERDAELSLVKAWETLGGIPITGLVAYVENLDEFEENETYRQIIEKKTETLYRSINQKTQSLPTSNLAVKTNLLKTRTIELTPQESEQLSKFVSDESYVKQQKEDIEELSAMFKKMLHDSSEEDLDEKTDSQNKPEAVDEELKTEAMAGQESGSDRKFDPAVDQIVMNFIKNYHPQPDFTASYAIIISDKELILHIEATPNHVKCFYAATDEADVILRTSTQVLNLILEGHNTFQRGFMAGEISAKGNFKTLRMLDEIFKFGNH
ncbi:MAG: NAD(P)H-dependent oxidoreductase [Lachnospiraceae bacterium]